MRSAFFSFGAFKADYNAFADLSIALPLARKKNPEGCQAVYFSHELLDLEVKCAKINGGLMRSVRIGGDSIL